MKDFWEFFIAGFLSCYNVTKYPSYIEKHSNRKDPWLVIIDYFNKAYKKEIVEK